MLLKGILWIINKFSLLFQGEETVKEVAEETAVQDVGWLEWMAWTPSVAIFYSVIGTILISMTIWEIKSPTTERKGFLPILTTRGDRLFIGLLGSAFINLFWLGLTGLYQGYALDISLVYMFIIARWG